MISSCKLLECPSYSNFKVVAMICGMQTDYSSPLCLWDCRKDSEHWTRKIWLAQTDSEIEKLNIVHEPLVPSEHSVLTPLHIKLGLVKNFVRAMKKDRSGFLHLCSKFLTLNEARLREGIFVGPNIRKVMNNPAFDASLNCLMRCA